MGFRSYPQGPRTQESGTWDFGTGHVWRTYLATEYLDAKASVSEHIIQKADQNKRGCKMLSKRSSHRVRRKKT